MDRVTQGYQRQQESPVTEIGGISVEFLQDAVPPTAAARTHESPAQRESLLDSTQSAGGDSSCFRDRVPGNTRNDESSDEELQALVTSHLRETGVPVFQKIKVTMRSGVAVVSGVVSSELERQMLFRSFRNLYQIRSWIDEVDVVEEPEPVETWWSGTRQLFPTTRTLSGLTAIALLALALTLFPRKSDGYGIATYPVTVRVTFEGHPMAGAFVVLHPVGHELPDQIRPAGHVQDDGVLKLHTFASGDGVPAGEYLVTAQWTRMQSANGDSTPGPNLLPVRYGLPTTSGLRVLVREGQTEFVELMLTR